MENKIIKCNICKIKLDIKTSKYNNNEDKIFLCKLCSDKIKANNINKQNILVEKECYFCKDKFKESFRNHGILYHGNKIHVCAKCKYVENICEICRKSYKILRVKAENNKTCSGRCRSINNIKSMNTKASIIKRTANQIKNKTGIYSEEAKLNKIKFCNNQVKNKEGIFNPSKQKEYSKLGIKAQRENNQGFFNKDLQEKIHKYEKENKIGSFFNPEQREKARLKGISIQKANGVFAMYIKYCKECKKETRHIGNRCFECDPWDNGGGFHQEYCKICKKQTLHNGSVCFICNPWEGSFDRNLFYLSKFNLISIESLEKIISFLQIDKYKGISGVWSKYNSNGIILDIAETKDIGKEMLFSIRALDLGKQNINKSDEEIIKQYNNSGIYIKYRNMAKYGNIIFKIDIINENDKIKRQNIEAQLAHDKKPLFWNPAPGQNIKIEE